MLKPKLSPGADDSSQNLLQTHTWLHKSNTEILHIVIFLHQPKFRNSIWFYLNESKTAVVTFNSKSIWDWKLHQTI